MSNEIEGLFFPNQILTAKGLGAFGAGGLSDGILTGCDVTTASGSITITPGWFIVCGRPAYLSESKTFNVPSSVGFIAIKASVDTSSSETSTSDTFSQVTLTLESNSSRATLMSGLVASGRTANREHGATIPYVYTYDINMTGETASTWLVYAANAVGNINNVRYNYSVAKSMILLWENSGAFSNDNLNDFAAQTISIPEMYAYDTLLIVYRAYYTSQYNNDYGRPFGSLLCPYKPFVDATYTYNLSYPYISQNNYDITNMRLVHINGANATVAFESAWYAGDSANHGSSPARCIPARIYGLKAW